MQRIRGRIAALALACVLLLSLGGSYALAQQPAATGGEGTSVSKEAKQAKGDKKERHKYKGVISAVRDDKIALKGSDGKNRAFTLDSKTRVKADGEEDAAAGDLKSGMKATVRAKETSEGSEKVAKVRAHTPKKDAKKKSEKASRSGR